MLKKSIALLMTLLLLACAAGAEEAAPLTGLPDGGEAYTPIAVVLDNSPEAYPHWGVQDADLLFQVPLGPYGNTRLLAVFGSKYPEQAGGVRSGRMTLLPPAAALNAAFVSAGVAPTTPSDINTREWLYKWKYMKPIRYYDLLGNKYKERREDVKEPWNLSAHVAEIHQDLVKRGLSFEKRGFLFTDDMPEGEDATEIGVAFREHEDPSKESAANACSFRYTEGKGYTYTRISSAGAYTDRLSGEEVLFANVIVLRCEVGWNASYPFYMKHMSGSGTAEFFMGGKHITGGWTRENKMAPLKWTDAEGNELALQRGKSWVIVGDDTAEVSFH